MKPIVCWNIQQAWHVKERLDSAGHHVKIHIAYPFKDYPRRDPKKKAFICQVDEPEFPPQENSQTVLSFIDRMLKFRGSTEQNLEPPGAA